MNNFTQVFQRVEKKYLLTEYQYHAIRRLLAKTARVDSYGESSILNIYYDTPDFRLIRTSIDGPAYKEKLRLRSYGVPSDDTTSFIEIKKKYKGVVYKRRIDMPYRQAVDFLNPEGQPAGGQAAACCPALSDKAAEEQIRREISWFFSVYPHLAPRMVISYDRIAMAGITDPDFRVTFDRNIRWRTTDLDLEKGNGGMEILQPGMRLMELKIRGAADLDLARQMSRLHIFPVSFSKYGRGYLAMLGGQRTGYQSRSAMLPDLLGPAAEAAI